MDLVTLLLVGEMQMASLLAARAIA